MTAVVRPSSTARPIRTKVLSRRKRRFSRATDSKLRINAETDSALACGTSRPDAAGSTCPLRGCREVKEVGVARPIHEVRVQGCLDFEVLRDVQKMIDNIPRVA